MSDPSEWEVITPSANLLFKPLENVQGDGVNLLLWVPDGVEGQNVPIALMIHGGAFTIGSAGGVPYNQIRYLLKNGIAVASTNYRKLPHVHETEAREDVLDAFRYLQNGINDDLALKGIKIKIDGSRVAVMGWSAGGHLTVTLAADVASAINSGEKLHPLRAMIPTYPVTQDIGKSAPLSELEKLYQTQPDVKKYYDILMKEECAVEHQVIWKGAPLPSGPKKPVEKAEIGSDGTAAAAPAAADDLPPRRLWLNGIMQKSLLLPLVFNTNPPFPKGTIPLDQVNSDFPPSFVVVATGDTLVPTSHSYDLIEKLKENGVEVIIGEANGMPHALAECLPGMTWPEGVKWWDEAILPSLKFAVSKLKE